MLVLLATWLEIIGSVMSVASFVVLATGVWLAIRQLQQAKTDRHVTILTEFSHRWDDPLLAQARQKAARFEGDPGALRDAALKLADDNDAEYWALIRLPNFFEDLGLLVDEKVIDLDLVEKSLGGEILTYWNVWRPYVESEQRTSKKNYYYFRRLAEAIVARNADP